MRKIIFIIGTIIAVLAIAYVANLTYTKSFSPESTARFNSDGINIKVYYCQPSKKDRLIFGDGEQALVPYGKVWRTGANEATEIEISKPVTIDGNTLNEGRYALFTIPEDDHWTVIFNSDLGQWGAFTYDEEDDVLRVDAKVNEMNEVVEMFTIDFTREEGKVNMNLKWDRTQATLPFEF